MMTFAAALIYWVIVCAWVTVLGTVLYFYINNPKAFGTTRLLLSVVAIDAARNIIENAYFGVYFGAQYGFFPAELIGLLGTPGLLLLPKLFNILAGGLVLSILLLRWLPEAVRERRDSEDRAVQLAHLAAIDGLTGLFNRRHFMGLAETEIDRAHRYGRDFSLLLLDIDRFKSVNDTHGHDIGDKVIIAIAQACEAQLRHSDSVGRFGGEEFAVLLPETRLAEAAAFADRLRQAVAATRVAAPAGELAVTISIGVSAVCAGATATSLIKEADLALYDAKRAGRDRVAVFQEPTAQGI